MRTCPNDGAPMQPRTKNNLTIDVCPNCHGIFLDYGEMEELERFASQSFGGGHGAPPPYGAPQGGGYAAPQGGYRHGHGGHHGGGFFGHGHGGHHGKKRRKKGFLSEFLD